jgi:hypothetical protein
MYYGHFDRALESHSPFLGGLLGIGLGFVVVLVAIWTLFWKGWALWRAARSGSKWWFVILLVVNTLGILEILYIFVFSKRGGIRNLMQPAKPIASTPVDEKDATVV